MRRALLDHRGAAAVLVGAALAVLATVGWLAIARAANRDVPWTVEVDIVAVVREQPLGSGSAVRETVSTGRIWFERGGGWRLDVLSDGPHGRRHRIFGTDGTTAWNFDPLTNRYTLTGDAGVNDPRATLAVMMITAGSFDLGSALAALQSAPDVSLTHEGDARVAGRTAAVVQVSPYSCGESGTGSTTGPTTRERSCGGFVRYWLDSATGWVLKVEADDGRGGGFTWDTRSAKFGQRIDRSLLRFTPPPGSTRVDALD